MKTRKTIAALLVALLMVPAAMAQTWEINEPTTVSTDVTADYTDIVAHEVLTFQRGAVFKPETGASTTNYIGTAAGDAAGLVFSYTGSGSSPNIVIPSATHNVFSGGLANPAVLLSGQMQGKIYLYTIDVSADAVTAGDEIPFATLSYTSGSSPHAQALNCKNFWNYNTKPVVIAFAGGSYRMVYSDATGFHVPAAANKIILRGVNGKDIVLAGHENAPYSFPLSGDKGIIATEGDCNLRFEAAAASSTFWVLLRKAFDDGQLDWGHAGETRFVNAKAQLWADDALPYSATVDRTNRVELISGAASGRAFLDLNGHSAKSGSLFVGTGAYVTNSADTAASLVFGEDNLDATFSGEIRGDVTLVKKGTGTLTIADGSVIPKIKLDGADLSTIVIDGTATVGAWEASFEPKAEGETTYAIANGETRDVGPFGLEPDWFWDSSWTNDYVGVVSKSFRMPTVIEETGLSNGLHRVTVAAGGTALVDVASGETEKYEYMALAGAGTLRKTGAGAATILGDNRVSLGKLHVAEGTLAFQGRGCTNEWWRIVVTEGFGTYCYIGKVGFFDEYGVWTSAGTGYAGYNQAASDLAQGKYTFVRRDDSKEPSNASKYLYSDLFAESYTMGMGFSLNSATDRVTITFRMPSGEKPAVWHSLASASSGNKNPKKWTIETSADGVNWTVANNIADSQQYTHKSYLWRNDQRYRKNEGLPWRIGIDNAPASVAALGTVQVDDGATLDLSATKNAVVSALEIDTAAIGGTIRGGTLAANGTVNVVSEGWPTSGEAVLTLDGVADAANIDSWPVSLNGVVDEKYKATFDSTTGNVTITREKQGMIIFVR